MKLQYKILWIDDNIENYIEAGINSQFEEFLANQGFDPKVNLFETGEKALEELEKDKKYDLILSDYQIAGGDQGDSLIRRIREGDIYTEVLFYSAQPNFNEVAQKLYQDRVSFLSLVGDDAFRLFKEKVYWLVNLTISKLQELNNMRGLVMAETSELDTQIEDILIEIMSNDSQLTKDLRVYMNEKIEENNTYRIGILNNIGQLSNNDLVKHRVLFDASKKSRTLNEYIKKSGLANREESLKDFHQKYEKDVLLIRNDMAHSKSDTIDGIEYLILSKDGDQPIKIDQEECIKIRTNLRKYTELLRIIKNAIVE